MEGGSIKNKVLGLSGQLLVVTAGVIIGMLVLEQMRKPRIAPPTTSPAPAQAS